MKVYDFKEGFYLKELDIGIPSGLHVIKKQNVIDAIERKLGKNVEVQNTEILTGYASEPMCALKKKCKEREITTNIKMKKVDLINLLEKDDKNIKIDDPIEDDLSELKNLLI